MNEKSPQTSKNKNTEDNSKQKPDDESLYRRIAKNNPFYLISAFCMLAGCYLLTEALDPSPERLDKMLVVLGILNIYEFLLIGLGIYLVYGKGLERDGRLLLFLAVLFLVDGTNLNTQCVAAYPVLGGMLSVVTLLFGVTKVGIIVYFLRLRLTHASKVFVGAQLAVLFITPGVFSWMLSYNYASDGKVPVTAMHVAWWIAGILVAVFPSRPLLRDDIGGKTTRQGVGLVLKALMIGPLVSIIVHLVVYCGVFDRQFYLCHLSPVLLGLAVYDLRMNGSRERRWGGQLRPAGLIAVSILLSGFFPATMTHGLPFWEDDPVISPFRVTLLVAAIAYFAGFWYLRRPLYAEAGAASGIVMCAGHSFSETARTVCNIARKGRSFISKVVPDTTMEWGVLAVGAAFMFLIVGGVVSFRRRRRGDVRRVKRLAAIITPAAKSLVKRCAKDLSVVLVVAVIVVTVVAFLSTAFMSSRTNSRRTACMGNLRMIRDAKQQWALAYGGDENDTPSLSDLAEYIEDTNDLFCPAASPGDRVFGRSYRMNTVAEDPECIVPGSDHEI